MVHGLREFADLVDEFECRREILELPRSRDRVPLPRPMRDFFQTIRDFRLGEKGAPRHDDPRACNAATRKKGLETVRLTHRARPSTVPWPHRTITIGVCATMSNPQAISRATWST